MYTVGIIGAGQLGSRHLQSLAIIDLPLSVYVADVSTASLNIARSRFEDVNTRFNHCVVYSESIDSFPNDIDVVIIATNSMIRKVVVEKLLDKHNVKHLILEKFLFPQISDYDFVERKFAEYPSMKVWVNCARRAYDVYKNIVAKIKKDGPVNFSIIGSGWGLACNSVHYVDLFSCLVNNSNIQVLNESIDDEYTASKREGYIEFSGSLYLGAGNDHKMEVVSYKTGTHPAIVRISTPTAFWIINETAKICQYASLNDGWILKTENITLPLQSEVGAVVVNNLLQENSCDLPPYDISQQLHRCLLETFLRKFNSINSESKELCPIT